MLRGRLQGHILFLMDTTLTQAVQAHIATLRSDIADCEAFLAKRNGKVATTLTADSLAAAFGGKARRVSHLTHLGAAVEIEAILASDKRFRPGKRGWFTVR